jgi:hypothetical protein
MRLVLFYLILALAISGLLYGLPEFKAWAVEHKRKFVAAISVPILIITFIYFMEVIVNA